MFFFSNFTIYANENSNGIHQISNQVNEKTRKTYELKIPEGEIIKTTPVHTGILVPFIYLFSFIFLIFIFFIGLRTYIYLYSFIKYKFFNNEKIERKAIQNKFLKNTFNNYNYIYYLVIILIIVIFYLYELPIKFFYLIM